MRCAGEKGSTKGVEQGLRRMDDGQRSVTSCVPAHRHAPPIRRSTRRNRDDHNRHILLTRPPPTNTATGSFLRTMTKATAPMMSRRQTRSSTPPTPLPREPATLSSFELLPDGIHRQIVSLLPRLVHLRSAWPARDVLVCPRACVSECSRTLRDSFYGTHWPRLAVTWAGEDPRDPNSLLSWLSKQQGLEKICCEWQPDALPDMCQQFVQRRRAFHGLKVLQVHLHEDKEPDAWGGMLAALQASCGSKGDVLPLVERLEIKGLCSLYTADNLRDFLEVLGQGALPALRHLKFGLGLRQLYDAEIVDAALQMVQARAAHPACRPFEKFETCDASWLDGGHYEGDEDSRARLLQALLPSLHALPPITWHAAFEACFVDIKPAFLKVLDLYYDDDFPPVSTAVWKSLPALESLTLRAYTDQGDEAGEELVSELVLALEQGAMLRLRTVDLSAFYVDDEDMAELVRALGHAPCAPHLTSLDVRSRPDERVETVTVLGDLLVEDRLPSLQVLNFEIHKSFHTFFALKDAGVEALMNGLAATDTRTRLEELNLGMVGMGDAGMAAVAGLVRAGRCERMRTLTLSDNGAVTDAGLNALTRALEETQKRPEVVVICGLDNTTLASQEALAAVVEVPCNGCGLGSKLCVERLRKWSREERERDGVRIAPSA